MAAFRKSSSMVFSVNFKRLLSSSSDGFRPRRSLLYVPGDDMKKIEKSLGLKADCVVLDCEDGVAINKKHEARATIKSFLDNLQSSQNEYLVRINPIESGLAEEDIDVLLRGNIQIQGLVLPKLEHSDDVHKFQQLVSQALKRYDRVFGPPLNFIGMIETAVGMLNMRSIMESTLASSHLSCQAFIFGSDDFLASIDSDGLTRQSEEGSSMGFTGKQIIHPNQIDIVNASFSPNDEAIKNAKELIDAFEVHQQKGKGAFVFKGAMIDMPSVKQAQNVLRLNEHMNK